MNKLPAVQLTERQAEFVRHLAQGVPRCEAARLAGYTSPGTEPSRLLQLPHIQAALKLEAGRILSADLLPKALGFLSSLFDNKTAADQHKLKASIEIVKANGLHKGAGEDAGSDGKSLASRSRNELEDLVTRLETAVHAHEAKTVDAVPDSVTVIDTELDDLLGS